MLTEAVTCVTAVVVVMTTVIIIAVLLLMNSISIYSFVTMVY
jgi:hypothetical protein